MALSTLLTTIENDLRTGWAALEVEVESVSEAVLQTCWNGIAPALTSVGPTLLADAVTIAQAAVAELGSGAAVGDVLTTMIGMAENAGKTIFQSIEGNLMTAIASIHLSAAIAAAPPAPAPSASAAAESLLGSTTSTIDLSTGDGAVNTTFISGAVPAATEPPLA